MSLRLRKLLRAILILVSILAVGVGIFLFTQPSKPLNPVEVEFVGFTNRNGRQLYAFEITNGSSRDISWSLHSRIPNLDTEPGLEHTQSYRGMHLNSHSTLRFASSPLLGSGERIWFEYSPYPKSTDRWRLRFSSWLRRVGWHRTARAIDPTFKATRVNGPIVP